MSTHHLQRSSFELSSQHLQILKKHFNMPFSMLSEVHFQHYAFHLYLPIPLFAQLLPFCPARGYEAVCLRINPRCAGS